LFGAKIKRPGTRNRTEGSSACCQVRYFDFATSVVDDSRLIAVARVDETNEPVLIDNECRLESRARIHKYSGRLVPHCDRRLVSRAVSAEIYETALEAVLSN